MKYGLMTLALIGVLGGPVAYAATADDNKDTPKEFASDASITTKIKADFVKDKTVSALDIHVKTHKGVVTLTGTANSKAESDQAETLAKGVKGVDSVTNDIKIGK